MITLSTSRKVGQRFDDFYGKMEASVEEESTKEVFETSDELNRVRRKLMQDFFWGRLQELNEVLSLKMN